MVLINRILWNNEMTLAICLNTELDESEFEEEALSTHLELTGDSLEKDEYFVASDTMIRRLELI